MSASEPRPAIAGKVLQAIAQGKYKGSDFNLSKLNPPVDDKSVQQLVAAIKQGGETFSALSFDENAIGNKGLECLATLSGLTSLDVNTNVFDDAGVMTLLSLTNLEYLNISGSKATNAGIIVLLSLPKLKFLRANGCASDSQELEDAVKANRTLLRLDIEGGSVGAERLARIQGYIARNRREHSFAAASAKSGSQFWGHEETADSAAKIKAKPAKNPRFRKDDSASPHSATHGDASNGAKKC